ncbi:hypothetical protein G6F68_014499 [Rhizopus microsporus]|nr:hypothetical protein G6F68_014499 [Rhizopus microsporus]
MAAGRDESGIGMTTSISPRRMLRATLSARHQLRIVSALAADEAAVQVDEHGFARIDIAHEDETAAFQRHGFRRHHPFGAFVGFHAADTQGTDAVGVAEGQQAVAGNLCHDGVGATHALVHGRHRAEDGVVIKRHAIGR